ncbi:MULTISPECIES: FHA domain-containing protein [unclassified Leifsonia]|uniref:FHA domain-containing protein n=1 Tax=unclassified Leifsonia TaxID=2663824 RepID=UPI0006F6F4DC|nr:MULTISPECIES: FHA domain-containing protein [unclassified Leifsonia]KQX06521.1 hypothetical protein ASC59_01250 [Leifsonia sp. Root1293]KRA10804.1 hypothetical protein ASD61_01250 [Leifsonia sp. Root60]
MGTAHVVHDARQPNWIFLIGEHFVAAVPDATAPAVVAAIAERTSRAVTVEELVSLIPLRGDDAVESFALMVAGAPTDGDGVPVSGVVRGDVAVDVYSVGGSRRFSDRGIRPWLLADFRAVTAVSIAQDGGSVTGVAELGTGEPVGIGPSRASRLHWLPGESSAVDAVDADDTVLRPRGRAEHDTVLRPRHHELASDAGGGLPETGDVRQIEPEQRPVVEQRPAADRQPETQPTEEQHPEPRPRFGLRIGQGEERELDAVYLIGRRPRLGRVPAVGEHVRLVDVPSPSREVSATHVEIRREGDVVVVTDQRSTNGTFVVPPHADRIRLRPGQSMVVGAGTMVHIGDDTIVTISALKDPPERSTDPR